VAIPSLLWPQGLSVVLLTAFSFSLQHCDIEASVKFLAHVAILTTKTTRILWKRWEVRNGIVTS
jgi:hypothetical protein